MVSNRHAETFSEEEEKTTKISLFISYTDMGLVYPYAGCRLEYMIF